jgi:hypothetical protein
VVEKVSGVPQLTIVPGPDPCEGTIEFSGGKLCCDPYYASFRVRDLCGTYEDIVNVLIWMPWECFCTCPKQGDMDGDGFPTPLDMGILIDVLFAGLNDIVDPGCWDTRSDFDCDGFATPLDLSGLIDYLFASGEPPCDPCTAQCL